MDPLALEVIAPMVVGTIFILTVGGVVLLKPLSKNLAQLLEAMARERQAPPGLDAEVRRLRESLDQVSERLHLLEERQDFTERLLERRQDDERIGPGAGGGR